MQRTTRTKAAKVVFATAATAGILAGVGFTVSLLVNDLSFGAGSEHDDHAKVAILTASLLAALLASVVLRLRNKHYRRIEEEEKVDTDADGVPDVFENRTD